MVVRQKHLELILGGGLTWCVPEDVEYKMNIELVNVIMDPSSLTISHKPEIFS